MSPGLLPDHIGPLVDRLRAGDHQAVSLPDVAALTEVLMRSLESYFKSIDLTIYQECQELADYIDDARLEISSLSPEHSDSVGIPRAGLELEAIVQQTESATNTIMSAAEKIMEADSEDLEAYTATVNDAVMQIFEACSFQDITGQRISKVVSTLEHVENRVSRLVNILGVMDNPEEKENTPKEEIDEDAALLNGPALDGEGIQQSEIDALLNDKIEFDSVTDDDKPNETPSPAVSDTEASPVPAEPVTEKTEPDVATTETASSEDIDFMFAEQSDKTENNIAETAKEPAVETPDVATQDTEVVEEAIAAPAADASPAEDPEVVAEQSIEKPAEEEIEEPVKTEEQVADTSEESAPAVQEPSEAEPNLIEQAKQKKVEAQAKKKAQAPAPKPVAYEEDGNLALDPKATGNTTQSDIDALFS
ncbi:MAG: protein phosphatase CheZ [Emcibacter sp.]|nr:protein phosphatase CheZ [Emcibacter sp.]